MVNYNVINNDIIIDTGDLESESSLSFENGSNELSRSSSPVRAADTSLGLVGLESTSSTSSSYLSKESDLLEKVVDLNSDEEQPEKAHRPTSDNKVNQDENNDEVPNSFVGLGIGDLPIQYPKTLYVNTKPFDRETFESEIDTDESSDEDQTRLNEMNTVRWREITDKDGKKHYQTNARLVKWSDGSSSLHVGSAIFNANIQPFKNDHNNLIIREETGLQGQTVLKYSFMDQKNNLSSANNSKNLCSLELSQGSTNSDVDGRPVKVKMIGKLYQPMHNETKVKKNQESGAHKLHTSSFSDSQIEDDSTDENDISLYDVKNQFNKK